MKYGWKFLHIDVFFQRTKPPFIIEFRDFVLLQGTSMPAWWKIEPLASWTTARNPKNGDAYSLVREPKGRSSRAIWRRKWWDVGRLTIIFSTWKPRIFWDNMGILWDVEPTMFDLDVFENEGLGCSNMENEWTWWFSVGYGIHVSPTISYFHPKHHEHWRSIHSVWKMGGCAWNIRV